MVNLKKQSILNRKIKALIAHSNDPAQYLYEIFADLKHSIDLNAETRMSAFEFESDEVNMLNQDRMAVIDKLDEHYQRCIENCTLGKYTIKLRFFSFNF